MGMESDARPAGVDFVEVGKRFGLVQIGILPGDVGGQVERARSLPC